MSPRILASLLIALALLTPNANAQTLTGDEAAQTALTEALADAKAARKRADQAAVGLQTLLDGFALSGAAPAPATGWRVAGRVVTLDGQPYAIRGANFSGYETINIWNGVWTANTLQQHIQLMQSIGINSVRIPLCTCLGGTPDQTTISSANAIYKGLDSWQGLDLTVTTFTGAGISVLLDIHTVPSATGGSPWRAGSPTANNTGGVISESQWIDLGVKLAQRYSGERLVMGIDIWNEPHDRARFRPGGPAADEASNPYGDWNYRHWAGQFYAAVSPHAAGWLFILEGVHENFDGWTVDWQNVYGENLQPLARADYRPDIPPDRVLWSPHVYGPDVGGETWASKPWFADPSAYDETLPPIWQQNWGFLETEQGWAIALGEHGSLMGQGLPAHPAYDNALVDYLISIDARDGWYWLWQPNSHDTGGIVTDENTLELWPEKVALLQRLWGI